MEQYYIFYDKINDTLNGCGQCLLLNEEIENIEVTEDLYNDYNNEPSKYKYNGEEIVLNENYENELAKQRKQEFLKDFFKVQYNGQDLYFRKQPKGYSSAVESINTAFNIVNTIGTLPAGSLVFYQQPDFTDKTQCTENWLVEHQVKSGQMSATEFGTFYAGFITAWNTQEHK